MMSNAYGSIAVNLEDEAQRVGRNFLLLSKLAYAAGSSCRECAMRRIMAALEHWCEHDEYSGMSEGTEAILTAHYVRRTSCEACWTSYKSAKATG